MLQFSIQWRFVEALNQPNPSVTEACVSNNVGTYYSSSAGVGDDDVKK